MAKHNVNISLGTTAYNKWLKIPQGTRSQFVEKSLGAYEEVDSNPKDLQDLISSNRSKKSEEKPNGSFSPGNKSFVTGRTIRANKKKKSSAYRKENITQLLSKL